ncbi:hypothetical protein [Deinococcus sp.]|uniref:hypothetical protein n=1 Tax=Deinococcus sp. TaxID=47478 RepID=UPI0025EEDE81|nr:hypothetical protein [Deinococcus sp.]
MTTWRAPRLGRAAAPAFPVSAVDSLSALLLGALATALQLEPGWPSFTLVWVIAALALRSRLSRMAPSLLSGVRREWQPTGDAPSIRAVQYSGAGASYLMVLNSSSQPQPLRLALPGTKRLRPLFSASDLRLNAGQLSGTLGALGVQVFAVQ